MRSTWETIAVFTVTAALIGAFTYGMAAIGEPRSVWLLRDILGLI